MCVCVCLFVCVCTPGNMQPTVPATLYGVLKLECLYVGVRERERERDEKAKETSCGVAKAGSSVSHVQCIYSLSFCTITHTVCMHLCSWYRCVVPYH